MKQFALTLFLIVAGCSSKMAVSLDAEFRPSQDFQSFEYRNRADPFLPDDDATIERARLAVLEDRLALNQMCQNGYTITNRQMVNLGGLLVNGVEIIYSGECI